MTKIMTKIVEAVLSFAANFPRRLLKNGFSRLHYYNAQHNFIFTLNHLHGARHVCMTMPSDCLIYHTGITYTIDRITFHSCAFTRRSRRASQRFKIQSNLRYSFFLSTFFRYLYYIEKNNTKNVDAKVIISSNLLSVINLTV